MPGVSCVRWVQHLCLTGAGVVAQLKISYSVHRDLNVKGNNERSFDFTTASPAGYAPPPLMPPSYGVGNGIQQQYGVPPGSVVAQAQQQGAVAENGDIIVTGIRHMF
jgi:hypothetical protein